MSSFNISTTYAKALTEFDEGKNLLEQVADDMVMLENTLSISKDLKVVLKSPIINKDKKASIIEEIFAEKVNKATLEFLLFVNSKNRENILLDIAKRFNEIRNVVLNRVEAEIVSSINFSDDQKNRLQKQLEEYSQKEIIPKFKTDESLIGGFTIKMNDTVIDASVKQQLKRLRKSLV
jgi:F-type H+-transporting ATPase subunit delta